MNIKNIEFDLATLFRVIGEKEMIIIKQNQIIFDLEIELIKLRQIITETRQTFVELTKESNG